MADLSLDVDLRGPVTMKEALRALGEEFSRTAKSAKDSASVFQRSAEQQVLYARNIGGAMSKSTQDWLAQERRRLAMMQESANIAKKQAQEEAAAALQVQKAREQQAAKEEMLRQKYDESYKAMQIYRAQVQELNEALSLGVLSQEQYAEKINQTNEQLASGTGMFSQAAMQGANKMSQLGVFTQQAGYQFGDFFVQVQSGTNWMTALGQQATQLVGFLPSLAAAFNLANISVLGLTVSVTALATVLGIGIPLLTAIGAYFLRSSESSDKAKEGIDKVAQAYESLQSRIESYDLQKQMLTSGVRSEEEQITLNEQNRLLQEQAVLEDTINQLKNSNVRFAGYANARKEELAALQLKMQQNEETLRAIELIQQEEDLKNTNNEVDRLQREIDLNRTIIQFGEDSLEAKRKQAEIDRIVYEEEMKKAGILDGNLTRVMDYYDESVKVKQEAEESVKKAKDLADALKEAASAMQELRDFGSGLEKDLAMATAKVEALRSGANAAVASQIAGDRFELKQKLDEAIAAGVDPAIATVEYRLSMDTIDQLEKLRLEAASLEADRKKTSSSGSGNELESQLEQLQKFLMDALEIENTAYQERQDTLRQALEQKLITIQEYNELEKELTEKHSQAVAEIESKRRFQTLQEMGTFFGAMANLAQAGGQKYIKVARVLGATEALINTFIAQSQVLRDPNLGFFGKMAAYAAIGAAGLGLVASLRSGSDSASASGGGGGSGMPKGSATVASNTGTPAPAQTVYISGLDPNALFTGEQLANLFDSFYKENDNRGKVFVVAR